MQEIIQLALNDAAYRDVLMRTLSVSVPGDVVCVDDPDPRASGVLVLDLEHLDRLPQPLPRAERVVLVTSDRPSQTADTLDHAWRAGVHSIVSAQDPVSTTVLAVLSARLRAVQQLPMQKTERRLP